MSGLHSTQCSVPNSPQLALSSYWNPEAMLTAMALVGTVVSAHQSLEAGMAISLYFAAKDDVVRYETHCGLAGTYFSNSAVAEDH